MRLLIAALAIFSISFQTNKTPVTSLPEPTELNVRVINQNNLPVPNVKIGIKDKEFSTTTDEMGYFRINVSPEEVITFTYRELPVKELFVTPGIIAIKRFTFNIDTEDITGFDIGISKIEAEMPGFDISTIPPSSARSELARTNFTSAHTLGNINNILLDALKKADWGDHRYYRIVNNTRKTLNGFVLVAQPEQIKEDGSPEGNQKRWESKIPLYNKESWTDYFLRLFSPNIGYFRMYFFVVTETIPAPPNQQQPTLVIMNWFTDNGGVNLPKEVAKIKYSGNFICNVYVYEFEKRRNKLETMNRGWRVKDHFKESRIPLKL